MRNVGGADKKVRLILAVVFVVAGFFAPISATLKIVLYALAGIAAITALGGFCPVNRMLGINTCKIE